MADQITIAEINIDYDKAVSDASALKGEIGKLTAQLKEAKETTGENSEETELLRYFRDNVLSQSPEGSEIIRLYYEWSSTVVNAMEGDAQFKKEVKEMIDEFLELIEVESE